MGNYIKIDRKILEWEWYKNLNTCRLFLHFLLKANWKDGRFEGKDIPRGSFVSSISSLSDDTGLTSREVRTAIGHLKSTGEVTSESHNRFTVFSVTNYDLYQVSDKQTDSQATNERQANDKRLTSERHSNDKRMTTIEEKKEIKEVKKGIYKQIIDLYNDICVSFSKVTKISENRKKAISARLKMYEIDDFKRLFELAEQSDFLKGGNDRNWSANFDWLIKDSNMAKVLDGNYNNLSPKRKQSHRPRNAKTFEGHNYNHEELERLAGEARDRRHQRMKEETEKGIERI